MLTDYELQEIVNFYNNRCQNITGINPLGNKSDLYYEFESGLTFVGLSTSMGFGLEMRCLEDTYKLVSVQGVLKTWKDENYEQIIKPKGV